MASLKSCTNRTSKRTTDQQTIQQLQQRLGETQTLATNAEQKADARGKNSAGESDPQRPMSALHNFTMVGDAEVQFGQVQGAAQRLCVGRFCADLPVPGERQHFVRGGLRCHAAKRLGLQNNQTAPTATRSTSVSLSFAQLDYLLNDYVTLVAGYMILPLGTYSERAAGWLNKIPDDPLAVDFLPGGGAGVQLRGAVPVGSSGQMLTYSVYGVNGPVPWTAAATPPRWMAMAIRCPILILAAMSASKQRHLRQPQRQSQRRRTHRLVLSLESPL